MAFSRNFESEEDCERALYEAKWPHGFRCPRCSHPDAYVTRTRRLPLYECKSCRHQTSVIAGTVLEGSRTSLSIWLRAIYLHSESAAITSALLSRILGITYKTAWLMGHKLRYAIGSADSCELLSGIVRMKVVLYRRARVGGFRQKSENQSLLVGASVSEAGHALHLKIKQVAKENLRFHSVLQPGVRAFVAENVVVPGQSDVICVSQLGSVERVPPVHDMYIEAIRWLYAFWNGIGPKHLQAYLNQFCFIWNMHAMGKTIFSELLHLSATMGTITLPVLVGRSMVTPRMNRAPRSRRHLSEHVG